MPSNVYLFDPSSFSANSNEKSLIQILREAEVARSKESAKIIRNAFRRVTGLFAAKKTDDVNSRKSADAAPADKTRLAA